MHSVSNGLARTMVAIAGTIACGTALMFAALGPGMAQTNAPVQQVAASHMA